MKWIITESIWHIESDLSQIFLKCSLADVSVSKGDTCIRAIKPKLSDTTLWYFLFMHSWIGPMTHNLCDVPEMPDIQFEMCLCKITKGQSCTHAKLICLHMSLALSALISL